MPGAGEMPMGIADETPQMSEEEARKIVEAAAKQGKISSDEASTLLQNPAPGAADKGGMSKLWKKISGK
jgi:hypothetical protein